MNREIAGQCFQDYVRDYDSANPMIQHKIIHTFRVADLADRIARSLEPDEACADFSWFLGLLHDIGRFEQVRQYGTFVDSHSVDHAQLGADLLFTEGFIHRFPAQNLPAGWQRMAETAIRLHNQLKLPDDLDEPTRMYAQILRDADKIDIFRVVLELPYEQRIGKSKNLLSDAPEVSPEVMACVKAHKCVPREARHSILDSMISHCCMAFELVYEESRRLALEQGHLFRLLESERQSAKELWGDTAAKQMEFVQVEIEKAWAL